MDDQGSLKAGLSLSFFVTSMIAVLLAYPPSASAVEVGCFCTFVFVSTMFVIGIAATLVVKYILSKKIWQLSMKRTALITFIEVILLIAILVLLQTQFYLRVLAYLPLAMLLNYGLTTAKDSVLQEQKTSKKRATMAIFSSLVLPIAVQLMAWLATTLSELITFKEVRV
jgi:LytS/YehU family sensor histidine kinase